MRMCLRLAAPALVALFSFAQTPAELRMDPAVAAAMEAARRNEPAILELQARLSEIPAPPFQEERRGRELKLLFEEAGLRDVRVDSAGNVIGVRPGKAARPNVALAAHLDTVFPEDVDVSVKREGDVMRGPGIGDNARGLAVIVAVARALNEGRVETPGTITFVANVGEEGLGDLRGMKALFDQTLKGRIDKFVSVDGSGLSITNVGVGSVRYRVTFKGPGGHSYGAFGMANPIHAMGRAIAKIAAFDAPSRPRTTFNVGRVGGGTSVNSIAFESWMEVDLRSADSFSLKALDAKFQAAVAEAVEEENRRWENRGSVIVIKDIVGLRPAGQTRADDPIVQTALAVARELNMEDRLREGSTDANIPMELGIPAITIGGGGAGSGGHSLAETFDARDSWRGVVRALLLVVALAR